MSVTTAPEHKPLPEGEWWACERPEAPSEDWATHYRGGCARCFPAWRMAALDPRATFYTDGNMDTPKALHPGHTEAEIRDWFMMETP